MDSKELPSRVGLVLMLFGVAVALSYPWELGQSGLYAGMQESEGKLWHCFRASLADGLLVLVIVGAVATFRRDIRRRPGIVSYLLIGAAGLAIGSVVEWLGVDVLRRWSYRRSMPTNPGIGLGLVPLLQMMVLPPVPLRIATAILRRGE
jgi:hypothetical protein